MVGRIRGRALVLGAAVSLALVGAGAVLRLRSTSGARHSPPSARDNLLLVTLDTTRADRIGAYGHARAKTPFLDRLAREGVRFASAFTPVPITLPSHAAILTGLYPPRHGVRNNGFRLDGRFETLATILEREGYRNAAFVSAFVLDRRYGLARGFPTYDDTMQGAQEETLSVDAERRGDLTVAALTRWLEGHASSSGEPFFAWLHLFDPHDPYRPPSPQKEEFASDPYDGEIAFDDAALASLFETLQRLRLADHTLLAVVGDHGESLGDHGEDTHGMFVYDAALRVPLILWRPGRLPAGNVVRPLVRTIDLAPTLLELLGLPPPPAIDGRSLLPLVEGTQAAPVATLYAETLMPRFYMGWAPLHAVRDARYKLIDAPRPELYDVEHDPGETRNAYADEPRLRAILLAEIERATAASTAPTAPPALDAEAAEKLAALGYVGAGNEGAGAAGQKGADPKDVIGLYNQLHRANLAVRDRRFEDALPILEKVLEQNPENTMALLTIGNAALGMGRYGDAIIWYRRYAERMPRNAMAHYWIAVCSLRLGDGQAAIQEAEAAVALDPEFADARALKGALLAARRDYPAAIRDLRAAIQAAPRKPAFRISLARALAASSRPDEAQTEYEAALALSPDEPGALTGLAVLLAQLGNLARAEELLRRAVAAQPGDAAARFNLASVLERQGRAAEASAEYRRLSKDENTPPPVREAAQKRLAALPK